MATNDRSVVRQVLAVVSGLVLGGGGLAFGTGLVVVATVFVALLGVEATPTLFIVIALVMGPGFGYGGFALVYVALRPYFAPAVRDLLEVPGEPEPFDLGVEMPGLIDLLVVAGGYAIALGGAFAGSLFVSMLQVETGTNQAAEIGLEHPETLLVLIPASILLIGPGEELLFRGVVQGRLREVFGPVVGVGFPSLFFAGVHWFALSGGSPLGNLAAVGVLVFPALVFGVTYEYTGNIVVPALIHGVYNATLFTLLYVAVTYSDQFEEAANSVLVPLLG